MSWTGAARVTSAVLLEVDDVAANSAPVYVARPSSWTTTIVTSALVEPPASSLTVTRTTYVPGAVSALPDSVHVHVPSLPLVVHPLSASDSQAGRAAPNDPPVALPSGEVARGGS